MNVLDGLLSLEILDHLVFLRHNRVALLGEVRVLSRQEVLVLCLLRLP